MSGETQDMIAEIDSAAHFFESEIFGRLKSTCNLV